MKSWLEFLRAEVLVHLRSLRGRVAIAAYLAIACTPAILAGRAQGGDLLLGGSTYAAEVLTFLPLLSAALAITLGLDAIVRERRSGSWSVLTLTSMSSAGYLLRRWSALLALLLPLSALPLAVAAASASLNGAARGPLGNFVWPWLLFVVPAVVGASALAVGAGTIADGIVPAAILVALLATLAPTLVNSVLFVTRRHVTLDASASLGTLAAIERTGRYQYALMPHPFSPGRLALPASESPQPPAQIAAAAISASALALAGCLAVLTTSTAFLRRSARDLPPWKPRADHPLRTLLALAARLRPRYAPDPRLERADRLLLACGPLLLLATFGAFWWRDAHYRSRMEAEHALEVSGWPAPTPTAASPIAARVALTLVSTLASNASLRSVGEITFRNDGTAPLSHLAFTLNSAVDIEWLHSDHGTATVERRLERVSVNLQPALAPRASVILAAELCGWPETIDFALPNGPRWTFERRLRAYRGASQSSDLTDLARSRTVPAASGQRVDLGWSDVFLLPRFTSWHLVRADGFAGGEIDVLPEEGSAPFTDLALSSNSPPELFVADACGGAGRARLDSACRMPLRDWRLAGAPLVPLDGAPVVFAVLPQHRAAAERLADDLSGLADLRRAAWPALDASAIAPVLLEDSPPWSGDPRQAMGRWWDDEYFEDVPRSAGRLFLVPERWVVSGRRLPAAEVVTDSVVSALLGRRPLDPHDRPVIAGLLRDVVKRRLGHGPAGGATLGGRPIEISNYQFSLLDSGFSELLNWPARLAAVTGELVARAGDGAVAAGFEAFLQGSADAGRKPGTLAELIDAIGKARGDDLSSFARDAFSTGALPELGFDDVHSARAGRGFVVTGRVANHGTGEARCPIAVTTEGGIVEARVIVPEQGEARFTVPTSAQPQSVLLDPDLTCFRWRGQWVERVDFEGFQ
ncbi:MAG: hypothetical protein ABI609_15430 [Acidobacteriota bacterium]